MGLMLFYYIVGQDELVQKSVHEFLVLAYHILDQERVR